MTLEAIWTYAARRGEANSRQEAQAVQGKGLRGDRKRSPGRQVTLLAREGWEAACAELGHSLPPSYRRANLLVSGVDLELAIGCYLQIGDVWLRVRAEADPCGRMDQMHPGLFQALVPDFRAGVLATVEQGGLLQVGTTIRRHETMLIRG